MSFTEVNYRRGLVAAVMQLARQEGYNNTELVSVHEHEGYTIIQFELLRPMQTVDTGIEHHHEYKELKRFEILVRNVE